MHEESAPLALITGSGMVATALANIAPRFGWQVEVHPQTRTDVTDAEQVCDAVAAAQPQIIFHTAALTRVNYCGASSESAARELRRHSKRSARSTGYRCESNLLLHGLCFRWHEGIAVGQSDTPSPINAYGRSKLAGEKIVGGYPNGIIVRTSGMFGTSNDPGGSRNFIRAITEKLCATDDEIRVVADQLTAITYAPHLATMLFTLIEDGLPQVIHITSTGEGSWCDWAKTIARLLGEDESRITAISTKELADNTPRPLMSILGTEFAHIAAARAQFQASAGLSEYLAEVG